MKLSRRKFLNLASGTAAIPVLSWVDSPTAAPTVKSDSGLKELNRLDAGELARRIARREVSPVEAIDAALTRAEETQAALNTFTVIDVDGARRAARVAETAIMRRRGQWFRTRHSPPFRLMCALGNTQPLLRALGRAQ